jgi:hypothetical protein
LLAFANANRRELAKVAESSWPSSASNMLQCKGRRGSAENEGINLSIQKKQNRQTISVGHLLVMGQIHLQQIGHLWEFLC